MALTGQAKRDYQREYMRIYMRDLRLKQRLLGPHVKTPAILHPSLYEDLKKHYPAMAKECVPDIDADGNPIPDLER